MEFGNGQQTEGGGQQLNDPSAAVIAEIAQERQRQKDEEGWSDVHDDTHDRGELAAAAACYALCASSLDVLYAAIGPQPLRGRNAGWITPSAALWPWEEGWFKTRCGARRMLVKAAALIIAEIERLDRASATSSEVPDA